MRKLELEAIYQLLAKVNTKLDASQLAPDQSLFEFGYDSLDKIGIVIGLEEQYSLSISDSDALQLKSVKNIVDFLNKKKSGVEEASSS